MPDRSRMATGEAECRGGVAVLQTRVSGVGSSQAGAGALVDTEDRAYALLGIAQAMLEIDDVKLPYSAIQIH
jgi:hypothetical protein